MRIREISTPATHDRAAADEKLRVRDQGARRHDPQRELPRPDLDRMTSVIAAAEAGDDVIVSGHQIDYAPFAFIAPLDTDDDVQRPGGMMREHDHVGALFAGQRSIAGYRSRETPKWRNRLGPFDPYKETISI
jgi:hypothetical protein